MGKRVRFAYMDHDYEGYLDMPEETEMVLKIHSDGRVWLHTGDLGTMDEQGLSTLSRG